MTNNDFFNISIQPHNILYEYIIYIKKLSSQTSFDISFY